MFDVYITCIYITLKRVLHAYNRKKVCNSAPAWSSVLFDRPHIRYNYLQVIRVKFVYRSSGQGQLTGAKRSKILIPAV